VPIASKGGELMPVELFPQGEHAVLVQFGSVIDIHVHNQVKRFSAQLERRPLPGMIEYIPAYTTVTVFYDPVSVCESQKRMTGSEVCSPYEWMCKHIQEAVEAMGEEGDDGGRTVEIPVCYGGDFGPDLSYVAAYNLLTEDEVIAIHSGGEYLVCMIGFAPGFPYIGGMSEKIATPRRASPRLAIPAGSVGIAGNQTGIYPIETPGGWQIIGRTPLCLFRPEAHPPSLLQVGDRVRFVPVSVKEFLRFEKGVSSS
jgi:inhibitor of KinA